MAIKIFKPVVPEDINLQQLQKSGRVSLVVAVLSHVLLALVFWFMNIEILFYFNVFVSVPLFFVAYLLNEKAYNNAAVVLASIEILLHQWLAIVLIGKESGFHYLLYMLIMSGVLCTNWKLGLGVFSGIILISVSLVILLDISHLQVYFLTEGEYKFFKMINTSGLLVMFFILLYWYIEYSKKLTGALKAANKSLEYKSNQIIRQNEDLEELNDTKTKLFSVVSHDLKGPINSLKGTMFLLEQDVLSDKELKKLSHTLSNQIDNTAHLLNNLLMWSKSQLDGEQIKMEKHDLCLSIHSVVRLLESTAFEKAIEISLLCEEEILVYSDKDLTEMVLRNLISNAIKFTNSGGHIQIEVQMAKYHAIISVKDNGQGMDQETIAHLFNTDTARRTVGTADEKGTGLGLSLCKDCVEKNRGQIWIESELHKGSTFYFTVLLKE